MEIFPGGTRGQDSEWWMDEGDLRPEVWMFHRQLQCACAKGVKGDDADMIRIDGRLRLQQLKRAPREMWDGLFIRGDDLRDGNGDDQAGASCLVEETVSQVQDFDHGGLGRGQDGNTGVAAFDVVMIREDQMPQHWAWFRSIHETVGAEEDEGRGQRCEESMWGEESWIRHGKKVRVWGVSR